MLKMCAALASTVAFCMSISAVSAKEIIHDAEYYILKSQNGEKWASADRGLKKKLSALKKKHGTPPNIIY